jgi:hypothetical protein
MALIVKLYSVVRHRTVIQVALNCDEEEKEHFLNTRRLTAWEAYICRTLAHVRVAEV